MATTAETPQASAETEVVSASLSTLSEEELAQALQDTRMRITDFFAWYEAMAASVEQTRADRIADLQSRADSLSSEERDMLARVTCGVESPVVTCTVVIQGVSFTTAEQLHAALERRTSDPAALEGLIADIRRTLPHSGSTGGSTAWELD